MARAGIRGVVLEAEGGVFPDVHAYLAKMTTKRAALDAVSSYYSWGPRVARHIVAEGRLTDRQVVVTGTPRMDFYASPWREAMLQLHPLPREVRRPFVLFNGTFNMINPWAKAPEMVVREFLGDGHDEKTINAWLETQRSAMQQFIELARRLARRLPDVDFVYRPHPFESVDTYSGCFDGIPNLQLIKQGTIQGWIFRASAIVHCGSSTAIDAALAGIPALAPSWIPSHLQLPTVEAASIACGSEDELADHVRAAVAGEPTPANPAVDEIIRDWYFAIDGRSHDRIASAMLDACKERLPISLPQCRRMLDGVDGPKTPFRHRLRHVARRVFNLPVHWSFTHWRDEPPDGWDHFGAYFGVEDVRSIVAELEPAARKLYGDSWRNVRVQSASERGEYHFNYRHGRAIVLTTA
jgi:surface carbohydrate biosynthesis protein